MRSPSEPVDRAATPSNRQGRLAACTIAAKSCLSFARVLAESFRRHHPDLPFFVLLADQPDGYFDPAAEPFQLIRIDELPIPDLGGFRFRYGQQPLTYSLTPTLLRYLLDRGFTSVLYYKQESLIAGDQTPIFDALERVSIVLTPHLLEPLAGADAVERELQILRAGVYNLGLLGDSYFRWLLEPCQQAGESGREVSRLWEAVYRSRPDVQRAFPNPLAADLGAFFD